MAWRQARWLIEPPKDLAPSNFSNITMVQVRWVIVIWQRVWRRAKANNVLPNGFPIMYLILIEWLWDPHVIGKLEKNIIGMGMHKIVKQMGKVVSTLTLGSRLRQGVTKVQVKSKAWKSHFKFPRVWESVKEWTLTFPSELPLWELESRWTSESSEGNFKGQNPLYQNLFYIIEKILWFRSLKWFRMTHLDT